MTEADEMLFDAETIDEIKQALAMGADVNATDKHGLTALHMAENKEITDFLIKAGADVNATDKHGRTALHMAENEEITDFLIKAGADVNIQDRDGRTALMYARTAEQTKLLLNAGANVGINIALRWAKTAEQTKLLLEAGADPNDRDAQGFSVADDAHSAEQLELLRKAGAIIEINEKKLEFWERRFGGGHISGIPEEAMELLGHRQADMIERVMQNGDKMMDNDRLNGITHALCHIYENGDMAYKSCRIAGDIILDKLIEKAEQGFMSYANRSIDGYWQSIKDSPEVWEDLKAVLEKHPNYAFGQKYLGYMNGEKPEDVETLKEQYLQDESMFFVTTMLMDVDGTLIQDGKINELLIENFEHCEKDHRKKRSTDNKTMSRVAVYTGGNPESQKQVLLKAAAEKILELCPSLQEEYTVDTIIEMHSKNDDKNMALHEDLIQKIKDDRKKAYQLKLESAQSEKAKQDVEGDEPRLVRDKIEFGKELLSFIARLQSKGDDQIKIYPKQAFVQDNICLAGIVVDDTQPEAQEIKSLSMAVLNPAESSLFKTTWDFIGGENLDVPEGRKMTAEQVFEMYQQKQKQQERISELKGIVTHKGCEDAAQTSSATANDSIAAGTSKPTGRGGR